ncbi:3-dehydro-L-gulonate 2-dehydrogenase [Ferruginibacter sp.]|nr:3-dehydro-L-gulonate 2-dehydrogenase [Ferruginibacter sp.]
MEQNATVNISAEEMKMVFTSILLKQGFEKDKAITCAAIFTANSIDGIYSHGVNRFPRFIQYVEKGYVDKDAIPSLQQSVAGIQQWNGNLGPGILNAIHATNTATKLAGEFGIGCVALANTNHWMRGGTYGWQAAKAGYVFIGWTNTTALMPAWGATDAKLGNNPLVIALPYKDEAIVLDMAMSQYSFGAMEHAAIKNENLSVMGGFDEAGKLTNDAAAIIKTKRPLPIGFWKGAGLSLLLDILAAILSGGLATHQIGKQKAEYGLSQVFIAIDISKLGNTSAITILIENIINDYKQSIPANEKEKITWPGERVLAAREKNTAQGIPVLNSIWQQILQLQ